MVLKISKYGTFLLIAFAFTYKAQAIGLSITPASLSITTQENEPASAAMQVANPSREVAMFEVYPEDFDGLIVPIPSRFTLQSGESRTVFIKVIPKQEGLYSTNLSLVARPLIDPILGIGSGVKLPIRVEITKSTSRNNLTGILVQNFGIPLLIPLLVVLGLWLFLRRRSVASEK